MVPLFVMLGDASAIMPAPPPPAPPPLVAAAPCGPRAPPVAERVRLFVMLGDASAIMPAPPPPAGACDSVELGGPPPPPPPPSPLDGFAAAHGDAASSGPP